jgi:hypothetical protein
MIDADPLGQTPAVYTVHAADCTCVPMQVPGQFSSPLNQVTLYFIFFRLILFSGTIQLWPCTVNINLSGALALNYKFSLC